MNFRPSILILFIGMFTVACGTAKRSIPAAERPETEANPIVESESEESVEFNTVEIAEEIYSIGELISAHAREFLGTRYKFGGTTSSGMDCSGLVYTAFKKESIELPRVSREMSLLGSPLQLEEVGIGDLLFFETDRRKKAITHVGLVVGSDEEDIYFIHSTNSQGVIISSLKQPYWKDAFVLAKRVL